MKKIILLLVLLVSAIAVNAATYRVKYDVQNQRSTTFTVSVGYDRLTINQTGYSLRRMGTITSSGITFDSYAYGSEAMECSAYPQLLSASRRIGLPLSPATSS